MSLPPEIQKLVEGKIVITALSWPHLCLNHGHFQDFEGQKLVEQISRNALLAITVRPISILDVLRLPDGQILH